MFYQLFYIKILKIIKINIKIHPKIIYEINHGFY
jgi:hypothetical protein